MIDLNEIRSLQDCSGMLYAGAVLEWTKQTDRDLENLCPEDFEDHLRWAEQNEIEYYILSESGFRTILRWINDPEWDNSEAYDLFVQVRESEYH